MKEKYYYLRKTKRVETIDGGLSYAGNHRCGIVALIEEDGVITRGISLCNDTLDPFLKGEGLLPAGKKGTFTKFMGGLELAKRRAKKALLSKRSSEPIQRQEAVYKVDSTMFNKSEFMPLLSTFEKKLLQLSG